MPFILLALALLVAQASVPVEQEPRHTVRFADAAMRVLEVNIPAGDTTLDHMHRHDIATVCVECAPTLTRAPGEEWSAVRTRAVGSSNVTAYTARPASHTVRNVGKESYHLIAVENLRPGTWKGAALPGTKPSQETASFRVYQIDSAATGPHTHTAPAVVVTVATRRWSVVPAGQRHEAAASTVEIELR